MRPVGIARERVIRVGRRQRQPRGSCDVTKESWVLNTWRCACVADQPCRAPETAAAVKLRPATKEQSTESTSASIGMLFPVYTFTIKQQPHSLRSQKFICSRKRRKSVTRSLLSAMDHQNSATSSTRSVDDVNGGRSVWQRVSRPEVVLAVGSPILLLVDIGLIIVFVLSENWQGVIYSGVVFFAWSQVIFWFFRTRTLVDARRQVNSCFVFLGFTLTFLNVSTDGGKMEGSGR